MFLPLKSSDISVITAVTALATPTASLAAVQSKSNCNKANWPEKLWSQGCDGGGEITQIYS